MRSFTRVGGRWYRGADVPRLLSAALWGAAPAWWNRADGERMRRSCMSSSPSLAEGDIWHHLACVHYGGQKELFASFSSFLLQHGSRLFMGGIVSNINAPTHTHTFCWLLLLKPPPFPPPPSIKVNKCFQQRANEHGPLSRDACLCCLPPRTLLVYLGCQVKGRLREGETFFFNKAGLVSIETAGQHYRDNDKRAKSGLRASRSVPHCCWRHLCLRQRNESSI